MSTAERPQTRGLRDALAGFYADLEPRIRTMIENPNGPITLQQIATALNEAGCRNWRGHRWNRAEVKYAMERMKIEKTRNRLPGEALRINQQEHDRDTEKILGPETITALKHLGRRVINSAGLARRLNATGHRTVMGKRWEATQVLRFLDRLGVQEGLPDDPLNTAPGSPPGGSAAP